jgi:hypothetical protein
VSRSLAQRSWRSAQRAAVGNRNVFAIVTHDDRCVKSCIADQCQRRRCWNFAASANRHFGWGKARDRYLHAFAFWAALWNRHIRRRCQRERQRRRTVTSWAISGVKSVRVAAVAFDKVCTIDKLLAVMGPFAIVVWIAKHHCDAAIDVASHFKCGSVALCTRCDCLGKRGFRELAHPA